MRRAAFLLLLPALGFLTARPCAGGDFRKANKEYQLALHAAAQQEGAFFKEASKRLREAYDRYRAQWVENYGKPDAPADIFYDLSGYRALYSEAEGIGAARGRAAGALAACDGKEAAGVLWKQLLQIHGQLDKLEKQLKGARAIHEQYHYDQEPVLRLLMHQRHAEGLVEALGALASDEALAWLAETAWKEAAQSDKRSKGVRNRVALLDAAARTGKDASWELLAAAGQEPELAVRMTALQGLGRFGTGRPEAVAAAALESLKGETAFPIRISALRILKERKAASAVGPLIEILQAEVEAREGGVICGHILEILKEFTGKDFGLNWVNWKGWFEKNRAAVEGGTFKKEGEGDGEDEGKKKMRSVTFYDIPTYSKGIVILIDASDTLIIPADVEVAKTRNVFYWLEASKKKLEQYKSQLDVLKEEAGKAIGSMDAHTLFNVVLLYKDDRKEACWPALVPATDGNKQKALKMILDVKAGGWAPQYEGLLEAFDIAGLDPYAFDFAAPAADTFYLLTDGGICGGRFMTPPAIVDAVKRLNRFRNATVHTVQIADLGADAVEFLKGLAEATGGTYTWRKK